MGRAKRCAGLKCVRVCVSGLGWTLSPLLHGPHFPSSAFTLAGGPKIGVIKAEIDDGAVFYVNGAQGGA